MDCFFVAVERLKDPSLNGKPVIVGGDPESRGVVSSASYEAREFGVHSAMPASQAKRLCPQAIFLRGAFGDYDNYSRKVRNVLEQFTPMVEMASIDEAYLDLSGTKRLYGSPFLTAEKIRHRILDETGLIASFGVSTNKLIAKIASDYGKPSAITIIYPGHEADFVAPMALRKIPGIGPSTEERLISLGIKTVGELAEFNTEQLGKSLGEITRAKALQSRARGMSQSPVVTERERKSISKEITFSEDIRDPDYLQSVLHYLSEQVMVKLRSLEQKAQTVQIKYRYPDFETHTRARTVDHPTDSTDICGTIARDLFMESAKITKGIRLIGMGVSQLREGDEQLNLFGKSEDSDKTPSKRDSVVDRLREKYGFDSILSGDSINLIRRKGESSQGSEKTERGKSQD